MNGCENKYSCRGYCGTHYAGLRKRGHFPNLSSACQVDGCARQYSGGGYCSTHYRRSKSGRPLDWERPPVNSRSLHAKLRRLWGPAKQFACIQCGRQAAHWAYDGTDPTQGLDYGSTSAKNKGWFSAWPEFYMPMCRQCHGQMDGAKASAELAEYREWKYATRMTLADITVVKAGINA